MNSTTAMINGSYEVWFKVPESTNGAHNIWIKSDDGDTASAVFNVGTKNKNIPSAGLPGDTISGSFYGFHGSKDIAFILSSVDQPTSTKVTDVILASLNGASSQNNTYFYYMIVNNSLPADYLENFQPSRVQLNYF